MHRRISAPREQRVDLQHLAIGLTAVGLACLAAASLSHTGWVSEPALPLAGAAAAAVVAVIASLEIGGLALLAGVAAALAFALAALARGDLAVRAGDPRSVAIAAVVGRRLVSDAAFGAGPFHSFFFYAVVWVSAAWLAWWAVRKGRPLVAALPVAALFTIGILNSLRDEFTASVLFLVLVLALWLSVGFGRLQREARQAGLPLSAPGGRGFWALGAATAAVAVAAAAVVPPLTTVDASDVLQGRIASIRTWLGAGADGRATGFSTAVPLGGTLVPNAQVVFYYTLEGAAPQAASIYFRGANLTRTAAGEWRFAAQPNVLLAAGAPLGYAETYGETAQLAVLVQVANPPPAAPAMLFYPGQLISASDPLRLSTSAQLRGRAPAAGLLTLDSAEVEGAASSGYEAVVSVSTATAQELEATGTDYPAWLSPYRSLGSPNFRFTGGPSFTPQSLAYRPAATLARIRSLAEQVTAGSTSTYDQVTAIESYLRSNYAYTLSPPVTQAGADPIEQFLFKSRAGYCQYFATAMGDLLRSLGIPTRLVNGFGPGTFDPKAGHYVVTEADAHTWVEAYFPGYGWIPFEPTPQSGYPTFSRGPAAVPGSTAATAPATPAPTPATGTIGVAGAAGGSAAGVPSGAAGPALILAAALLAGLGLLALFVTAALLVRPRSIPGTWWRLQVAAGLAGVARRASETPFEFGGRLNVRYPELSPGIDRLVGGYSRAAYGPRPAATLTTEVLAAWRGLGPALAGKVLSRFRKPRDRKKVAL